jgi:hypothetical protein
MEVIIVLRSVVLTAPGVHAEEESGRPPLLWQLRAAKAGTWIDIVVL